MDKDCPFCEDAAEALYEARAQLAAIKDPTLKHLKLENGQLDMALAGPIVEHIAMIWAEWFIAQGAQNYVEMSMHEKQAPYRRFILTIQEVHGENSPHQLRMKAEAERDAALAELDRLKAP